MGGNHDHLLNWVNISSFLKISVFHESQTGGFRDGFAASLNCQNVLFTSSLLRVEFFLTMMDSTQKNIIELLEKWYPSLSFIIVCNLIFFPVWNA